MHPKIERLLKTRQFLLAQLEGMSHEQFNKIPEGFNNNIIWNLGHLVAVQQSICYLSAGQSVPLEERFFGPFRPGSKPEAALSNGDIALIKASLIESVHALQADMETLASASYTGSVGIYQKFDILLNDIESALEFLLYHEGTHFGYILAMKHLIDK